MGTNYYLRYNYCPCCGHPRSELHLGKASHGWRFIFNKTNEIQNFEDFKNFIERGTIYDEYDRIVSYTELIELINYKQKEKIDIDCELIDGYVFSDSDFC